MNALRLIFNRTLNNVIFGIAVMVATGMYIAIGSGVPRVREAFEMNELQFFNAWPLKVLMLLLIASLSVVTWTRIPLTLPRAGVWMIHGGIVTLIFGLSIYYYLKVEGLIYISQQQTVNGYYDGQERSLYIRYRTETGEEQKRLSVPLTALPRFKTHRAEGEDAALNSRLKGQALEYYVGGEDGTKQSRNLGKGDFKLADDITFDVIGYHPYANIVSDYQPAPDGKTVGIRLTSPDPHSPDRVGTFWLVWSDAQNRMLDLGGLTMEHWHLPMVEAEAVVNSAKQMHKIDVAVGEFKQSLSAEIGKKYDFGNTGYSVTVENFNPAFPMSGTGEMVKVLTLMVKNTTPGKVAEFRRMVIDGKPEIQTDFKLGEPGAGPMGKRQKEPLDKDLVLTYKHTDPLNFIPRDGSERHLFITGDKPAVTHMIVKPDGSISSEVLSESGAFSIGPAEGGVKLAATKVEKLARQDRVVEVPPAQRQRMIGESGTMQVLTLRLKCGSWSDVVNIPFIPWTKEGIADWTTARPIEIPGVRGRLQLAMGNTWRPLPAQLTLEDFKLVNYPGGTVNDNLFRDFVSTLRVTNPGTGEQMVGVAKMNSPIYYDSGRWLFFQSQYDKQNMATIIGVGNRPGVGVMTAGCIMMAVGLLYAFYLKPVIIRRRKERAIREAGEKKAQGQAREPVVAQS